ncbi:hypothetical protein EI546_10280 [Aequorivita sp. H23M31]|uniref:Uncharacterized protein n=1 Tax=Aequorivita ciconiae TaxID=2494375 RepID=A0A410G4A0_9FLAO|nr:hypothetical protein [Aequorivita sp. H23M31]QAA82083.1 hypothetical protein EI546_10280 [Aequorivita sp. H23M31]
MKNIFTLLVFVLGMIGAYAQEEIPSLTYGNTQDINFFSSIKNGASVKEYTTANNNIIKVGDTIVLGLPTSHETNTRTYANSYGSDSRGTVAESRSTSTKTFQFIKMGKPAGLGIIVTTMSDESQDMADMSLKNTNVVVKEIKTYHRGSKKKPLYVVLVLGELNGRAFGVYKYLSVMDTELAIESGEILLKNQKMTREEAIAKLKEAKELMDVELMNREEFEDLKKELTPLIKNQN